MVKFVLLGWEPTQSEGAMGSRGRGGRGRGGRGRGRPKHQGGQRPKLSLPFKLQRELGLEPSSADGPSSGKQQQRARSQGRQHERSESSRPSRVSTTATGGGGGGGGGGSRTKRLMEDNEKDERLMRSLAKKLKMKSASSKFGLDDGLNDILEGLPETSAIAASPSSSLSSPSSSSRSTSFGDEDEGGETISSSSPSRSDDDEPATAPREAPAGRYVPPGLQKKPSVDDAIARKVRGLLNRITETSVQSIVVEIGGIVQTYQIQKKVIQDLICNELIRAAVEGPRASAHFAAVTSICAFGLALELDSSETIAKFCALLAQKIDRALREKEGPKTDAAAGATGSPALHNLVLILVHLPGIGALSYATVFSFLFQLKDSFTVADVECIYTVLRYVGCGLRTSDPARMKDFVIAVHEKAGQMRKAGPEGARGALTQKQEILLKSFVDIKNNRQRGNFGRSCHQVNPSIGAWLKRSKTEGLCLQNLSWDSLLSKNKMGLWWLSGSDLRAQAAMGASGENRAKGGALEGGGEPMGPDFVRLASEQRMNTDIRRSIFVVVMSSEDYVDAFERLLGLGLKGSQEREISRVLLHCCLQEKAYNPYYFYIAKALIKQSKQQKLSFIFTISDKIKEMDQMGARSVANLAKLVAVLVMQRLVPFTIIKALKITGNFVNKKPALFLQMLLEEYLERSSEAVIHEQLLPLYMKPEYSSLTQTLSMYLMKQFPKYLKHSQMEKTAVAGIKIKSAIALKALRGTAM